MNDEYIYIRGGKIEDYPYQREDYANSALGWCKQIDQEVLNILRDKNDHPTGN